MQVLHGFAEVGGEIVIGISRCGCLAICAPSRVEEVAVADVAVEEVLNWAFRRLCAVGPELRNVGEQAVVAEVAVGRGIAFVGKALLVSGLHVGNEGSEIFVALELVDRAENGINLFLRNVEEAPARVRALGVPHYECIVVAGAVQGGTFRRTIAGITDNGVFNQRGALDNEGILVLRINEVGFFGFFRGGHVRTSFVNHAEVALRVKVLHIIAGSVFLGNEFPDVLSILCRRRFGHFPRLSVGPVCLHAVVVNGIRLGAHRTEVVPAFLNGHCACLGGSNGGFAACYGCFGLFLRQVFGVQECLCGGIRINQFVVKFLADLSRFGTGVVEVGTFGEELVDGIREVVQRAHLLNLIDCPGVLAVAIAECGSLALGVSNELNDASALCGVGHAGFCEHECAQSFACSGTGPVGSLGFDSVGCIDVARLDREHEGFCLRSLEVHVVVRLRGGVEKILARRHEFHAIGRRRAVQVFACQLESNEVGVGNGGRFGGNAMEEVAAGAVGIVEGVRRARNNLGRRQLAAALEANSCVALLGITTKPDCEEKQ